MTIDFTFWLAVVLFLSVACNCFFFWYNRKLLSKLLFISENLNDLVSLIQTYKKHLKEVHTLEQYYGDQEIKFLVSHTNSLMEVLGDYEDVYSMTLPLEISYEEEEENYEETNEEIQVQKNVFYGGTRSSDS